MRPFEFTIRNPVNDARTGRRLLDALTDPLFARFEGDVVPALIGDDLVLDCTVSANTLSDAVREVSEYLVFPADRAEPAGQDRAALPGRQPLPAFRVEAAGADVLAA